MRTTIFAWVALLGLSMGSVAQAEGPLKIHPKNPRYVAGHDGNAIFLTGSHTWPPFKNVASRAKRRTSTTRNISISSRYMSQLYAALDLGTRSVDAIRRA